MKLVAKSLFFFHSLNNLEHHTRPVTDETQEHWCCGISIAKVPIEIGDQTNASDKKIYKIGKIGRQNVRPFIIAHNLMSLVQVTFLNNRCPFLVFVAEMGSNTKIKTDITTYT